MLNLRTVFLTGILVGGIGAWWIQHLRIQLLQSQYQHIVDQSKVETEIAKKQGENRLLYNQRQQEASNGQYQRNIDQLHVLVSSLQHARTVSSFVPSVSPVASKSDVACFDRSELERTLQQFDGGIQGLITEGDATAFALNNARVWAATMRDK